MTISRQVPDDDDDDDDNNREEPRRYVNDGASDESVRLRMVDTSGLEPPNDPEIDNPEKLAEDTKNKPLLKLPIWQRLYEHAKYFRPYFVLDYLDYKSLRIVSRTWLKTWVASILTLIQPVNMWLGQASYLLMIYSFVIPCGTQSISQSIQWGVICVVGACIGFLHSVIAMAISTYIRGNHPLEYYAQQLVEEGLCKAGPELATCVQEQIFHGHFIYTKGCVIFIIAMLFGYTFFVYVKLRYHAILFVGVVGIISLSITGSYGMLQPAFTPVQLGLVVIKPLGITFAMNLVFSILLFPKTSNFSWFSGIGNILGAMNKMSTLHMSILQNDRPSQGEFTQFQKLPQTLGALRAKLGMIGMEFVPMTWEVSYGRFNKPTAVRINASVVALSDTLQSFEIFYQYLHDCKKQITGEGHTKDGYQYDNDAGVYEHRQRLLFKETIREKLSIEYLDEIMDIICKLYMPILEQAHVTFGRATAWLDAANHYRAYTLIFPWERKKQYKKSLEHHRLLSDAYTKLQAMIAEHDNVETSLQNVLESYKDEGHVLPDAIIPQVCLFWFMTRQYCLRLSGLVRFLLDVDEQRPTPQFIHYWTPALKHEDSPQQHNNEVTPPLTTRDPDALPAKTFYHKIGRGLALVHRRVVSDKMLITAFRAAIFAVLTSLPVFFHSTAWFFYHNRLVWASIMTPLSVFPYLGDTLYAWLIDSFYTLVAGVLALMGWYIGNGHGKGNPYGMGAVYAVFFLGLTFYRHFSQHLIPLPAIFICVTFVLIMGTSWQDTHYVPNFADIGVGWHVTWMRFVTVLVGVTSGAISSIVPKPFTIRKVIRVNLGQIFIEIGNIHASILNFAVHRARDSDTHVLLNGRDHILKRMNTVRGLLADTRRRNRTVKFEPALQGIWPKTKYLRILKLQADLMLLYRYLYSAFNQIKAPSGRCLQMTRKYGWTNSALNSDFQAVLHMCSSSLVMRTPLPMLTPAQTSTRYREWLQEAQLTDPHNIDLSFDGAIAIAGYCLVARIYARVDDVALITKELVGEEYSIDGFYFDHDNSSSDHATPEEPLLPPRQL